MTTGTAAAAMAYAARGWAVLPLHAVDNGRCTCGRRDCESPAKHPHTRNGSKDATVDPDQIRAWWQRWPDANLGLATGYIFDALDIDNADAYKALGVHMVNDEAIYGPTVRTARGWHVYVSPTGYGNTTSAGGVAHVDWRGRGGYVVAPPSVHPSGRRYRWCAPSWAGVDTAIEPAPAWLLDLLQRPEPTSISTVPTARDDRYGQAALDAELGRLAVAPVGDRNYTLVRAAFRLGQLVGARKLDAHQVAAQLLAVAVRVGLPEPEAVATIKSGLHAGVAAPRGQRQGVA